MNTNTSMSLIYNKVLKLLDEMAPYKKLTQKEIQLQQKPWITNEILLIMQKRDALYKDFVKEKNAQFKNRLGTLYRSYINQVVSLIRKNKKKYYAEYFEQHQANIRKTCRVANCPALTRTAGFLRMSG